MDFPKLRPIEALPVKENLFCLRDPSNFSPNMLLVPPTILYIISLFDGIHSLLDIQQDYTRKFGDILFSDRVKEIITQMENNLFLDSPHFREERQRAVSEFKNLDVRKAAHSGISYESDALKLGNQLSGYFKAADVPPKASKATGGRLKAVIAPHIDLKRGCRCYARSYSQLRDNAFTGTYIILGISHHEAERKYILTRKDFETPLGIVRSDTTLIDEIARHCHYDFFSDEFLHRDEHSIEFQVLFLQHLSGGPDDTMIVPILCSSYHPFIEQGKNPRDDEETADFMAAVRKAVLQSRREVCFIAAVDLSHVGRRFGQSVDISDEFLQWLESEDMKLMDAVLKRDGGQFFRIIRDKKDSLNVCGTPAIFTLLNCIEADSARLLHYDQAVDRNTDSVVTFAALSFYVH